MSLLVWLPLNGDSHNQGLGKYIEKANTLAYTTNGKVTEKCADKGKLIYNKNPLQMVGTICFWLYPKPTAEKSSIIFGNNSFNDSNRKWTLFMFPNNKSLHSWGCQKEGSNTFNGSFTYENVLKESTWNHVCVAHDLKNEYIYVNGNLIGTVPWDSSGTYNFDKETDIIRDETFETGTNNFKINDFRIYDTCLSKAEVMEIAKGKMLHYTFENPYVTETTNIPHSLMVHDNHVGEATLGSDSTGNYVNKTGMTLWSGIGIADTLVKSGRYYTWSMEVMSIKDIEYVIDGNGACKNSSHGGNDIHFDIIRGYSHQNHKLDGSDTLPKGKLEAYKWTRIYFTIKVKQDCTNPVIFTTFIPYIPSGDSSVKVYYRNSQLEEKPYDTPYTSSNREAGLIRDNSGMGNDGTQVYQREEIPIIGNTTTNSLVWTAKDPGETQFEPYQNQRLYIGSMNHNSRYFYLNSIISYEFDIKLENTTIVNDKSFDIWLQGITTLNNGTQAWYMGSPVHAIKFPSRLKNGTNGTYHITLEQQITNSTSITNAKNHTIELRVDFINSGTVTVSNLHAYYDDLDTSKLTIADKSVIGSHSLYLNGKNYINCGVVTPSMMDELTASIWLYRDDWTIKPMLPLYSSFFGVRDNGGFAIGPNRSITHLNFEVYYNSIGYIYPNVIDMTKLSAGWHLITGVANKNKVALYLDGELYNENVHNKNAQINMLPNNNSTIARMPIYVGAELDGWGVSPTLRTVKDYYIDDVRLYATALSDKDIKALYNVKARIDNKSNLYCNQLVETKSKNLASDLSKIIDFGVLGCNCKINYDTNNRILTFTLTSNSKNSYVGPYILNKYYGGRLITNKTYRYSIYVKFSKSGTWKVGEERIINSSSSSPFYNGQKYEAGKWYKIENEGIATANQVNFIFYYCSGLLEIGDKIEIRDFKMYRLYDTDNYTQKITKKGQYKTFELDELKIDDTNYMGATIVDKYGAEWLEVFYHNTNGNTVWFTDEQEALHTNSQYKFSILDRLENFRGIDNKFEFLLEYPQDLSGQYNRWKQTDNPALVQELSNSTPSPANGYEAIHVDWTSNGWGGLLKSQKGSTSSPIRTFIDGSTNYGNWFYSIGCYNNKASDWENAMPGPNNTPSTGMKEVHLYVRIDNLPNKNEIFRQYKRQTKTKEIIEI